MNTSAQKFVIEYWPVVKLVPYIRNARTHTEQQVAQIAASIKEFGWTNPILIGSDDVIIAGHARLRAAQKLSMTVVPVIVLGHLTQAQRRALVLADNKLARLRPRRVSSLRTFLIRSRTGPEVSNRECAITRKARRGCLLIWFPRCENFCCLLRYILKPSVPIGRRFFNDTSG